MAQSSLDLDLDWSRAAQAAENARKVQPDNPYVLSMLGDVELIRGHWDAAIGYQRQAIARDPLSPGAHSALGYALLCGEHYAEAEVELKQALGLSPEGGGIQSLLGITLLREGRLTEAAAITQHDPTPSWRLPILTIIYHAMGRRADAEATLAAFTQQIPTAQEDGFAHIYAARGDVDRAYAWVDKGYAARATGILYIKCWLTTPAFKTDPRYKAFLRKMNLPE